MTTTTKKRKEQQRPCFSACQHFVLFSLLCIIPRHVKHQPNSWRISLLSAQRHQWIFTFDVSQHDLVLFLVSAPERVMYLHIKLHVIFQLLTLVLTEKCNDAINLPRDIFILCSLTCPGSSVCLLPLHFSWFLHLNKFQINSIKQH